MTKMNREFKKDLYQKNRHYIRAFSCFVFKVDGLIELGEPVKLD